MRNRDEWNKWYAKPNPWGTAGGIDDQVRTRALTQRLRHARFDYGLDLGCGEGGLTNELAKICEKVVGYDISDKAIERARSSFPHVRFGVGDLLDVIKLPEVVAAPFDFISVAETLYYLQTDSERQEAVAGLARLGAPSCLFFVSVIVNSPSKYRRYFTHNEIVALLEAHFVVIESFPCLAQDSLCLRLVKHCAPTRDLRMRLTELWTSLQAPEHCKHSGYFALKRSNSPGQ